MKETPPPFWSDVIYTLLVGLFIYLLFSCLSPFTS
nr:MAG TPA: Myc target protein 1 [Caudoviricetes sp.]